MGCNEALRIVNEVHAEYLKQRNAPDLTMVERRELQKEMREVAYEQKNICRSKRKEAGDRNGDGSGDLDILPNGNG